MRTQTSTITWMKKNRFGPFFLVISLFLEALYLFQPLVDSGLNQMFQSFQRMGIDAIDSKSILPLMIYIFVVKLSFLWRIPFLIYGFLWVKAIAKDPQGTAFQFTALLLFVLPFYLALFLMPFSHFLRIPPDVVLPVWWTWFILVFAVAIGLLYEVFEFRHWTDGKLNLPFFYIATVIPYFFIDVMMQFTRLDYHGLHTLYLICVGFSISFSLIRKVMKES